MSLAMWLALGGDASLVVGVVTVRVVTHTATPVTDPAITALTAINPVRHAMTSTTMALASYTTTSVTTIIASYATISITIITTDTQPRLPP